MTPATPATPAVIRGVVTDATGNPLADAAVAIAAAPVAVPDIAALTGPDGRFAIAAPAPGGYTVVATAPGTGTGTVTVQVDVSGASETEVEIRVAPPESPSDAGESPASG